MNSLPGKELVGMSGFTQSIKKQGKVVVIVQLLDLHLDIDETKVRPAYYYVENNFVIETVNLKKKQVVKCVAIAVAFPCNCVLEALRY